MKINGGGIVVSRPLLIEALVANCTKDAVSEALGYNGPRAVNKRMQNESITRQRLPCGVTLIIVRTSK